MMTTPDKIQAIPKAELHRHLDCSMRQSTLKELARAAGLDVPTNEAQFDKTFLVTTPMTDLESVLKKFLVAQQMLSSEEILTRLAREVVEDAAAEGVRILELRYAPTFIQGGHPHLTFEKIHQALLAGIRQTQHLPIAVGLIMIVQRTLPMNEAEYVVDFAIENKKTLVALDLADNESGFAPKPFAPMFMRARKAGLNITVHAGEADYPEAPKVVMDAINLLGAQRIGHGFQIHRDRTAMEFVRDKKIPLELCPTSNWLIGAVLSINQHPFRKLMEFGIPVTINTDDPGVFKIDLRHEYQALAQNLDLSPTEFEKCNDFAAAASFIPLEQKQKYWPRTINESIVFRG